MKQIKSRELKRGTGSRVGKQMLKRKKYTYMWNNSNEKLTGN